MLFQEQVNPPPLRFVWEHAIFVKHADDLADQFHGRRIAYPDDFVLLIVERAQSVSRVLLHHTDVVDEDDHDIPTPNEQ